MDDLDYWRLCDELTIDQAAHLIIGMRPGEVDAMAASGAELTPKSMVKYQSTLLAATSAIGNALRGGRLPGKLRPALHPEKIPTIGTSADGDTNDVDTQRSTVLVVDLKAWLWERGLRTGFFFPDSDATVDYLDPSHPRYANKLAAAVRAWQATEDPGGKHPKQALLKWLREHSSEFNLSDEEGRPNEQGIEECAKVANWQPGGGAPRTPGH